MGNNPKRTSENRMEHDSILKAVALNLQIQGFYVQADHIMWINGAPIKYNGHIPDIVATNNYGSLIIEIEDSLTFADEFTREQLSAFSGVSGYASWVIIPEYRMDGRIRHRLGPEIKELLKTWGLSNINIGTYKPGKCSVKIMKR